MSYEEPRQVKPARDAYAARGGWHSERQATSITYHSRWGQVARHTVTPEMLDETT